MKLTRTRIALLLLSIAGFFDSAYLTISHYQKTIPPCTIAKQCDTVLTSQFSTILGIPIVLIGSLYFLALIFLLLINRFPFLYFKLLAFSGLVVSAILFGIQAFVLQAYCQYCILSEIIVLTIFVLSLKHKE